MHHLTYLEEEEDYSGLSATIKYSTLFQGFHLHDGNLYVIEVIDKLIPSESFSLAFTFELKYVNGISKIAVLGGQKIVSESDYEVKKAFLQHNKRCGSTFTPSGSRMHMRKLNVSLYHTQCRVCQTMTLSINSFFLNPNCAQVVQGIKKA